jgi:hypothetical protein
VIHQKMKDADMWSQKAAISDDDATFLYEWLHAHGKPCTIKDLTLALIERRVAQRAKAIQTELSKGEVYQPGKTFQVGQTLIFPALDFAAGAVASIREGVNPIYPLFKVIQVEFTGGEKTREFPAELDYPHKLNADVLSTLESKSPKEIYQEHKASLEPAIESKLAEVADLGFAQLNGRWFLRELMTEVHIGHRNIAEAIIELNNRPVSTDEILKELDLPAEVKADIRRFSAEIALRGDERFTNVGNSREPLWFLSRLIPPAALQKPQRLASAPIAFDRDAIHPILQQVEGEIDDETSDLAARAPEKRKSGDKVTLVLIYPHRRAGTLPITPRTRGFFPESEARVLPVRLIDGRKGESMNGWVIAGEGYVYGLDAWYAKNQIPAGAYVSLQRTGNPSEIIVDYSPRRMRREWVRVAHAEDGKLTFQMTKFPIECEYDEMMLVGEDQASKLDALWIAEEDRKRPVLDILLDLFPELAKLNPLVHAKTIYATFNILRRCPPGPIFYELSINPCFKESGNGYWTFDANKLQKR